MRGGPAHDRVAARPWGSSKAAGRQVLALATGMGPPRLVPWDAGTLAMLQRSAGNRAVTALLQRDVAVAPAPQLTSAQSARAVSFYRGKPDLYPTAVVIKIQHAVKSPETGVPDSSMAEGVAQFQLQNVLKVDGMAGPRTLPRLFESGLATEADRKEFVAAGKKVETDWVALATPEARADKLFEGVKAELDKEKVFTPGHDVRNLGKAAGVFEHKPWTMSFDRGALSAATADDDAVRDVAQTVYHEARHAEQFHKMARMWAAKGRSADQISAEMGIPPEVGADAAGNPLPRDVEFATAAQQYDSVYGPGKAQHDQAEAEAPSKEDLAAARDAVAADPSPANKAKLARVLAAFKAYHDLPTEADAFATEIDFGATWDEATALAGP